MNPADLRYLSADQTPEWQVKQQFEERGGRVFEFTAGEGVDVHDDGVALQVPRPAAGGNGAAAGQGQGQITGRLLIDCMGNFSPIVRQVRKKA